MKKLGPGIITGAADDDPSGITTYSQTGAQFGSTQLWTALFILPFLVSIQELCARIGMVTGKGLAGVIRENSNKFVLYFTVCLVFIANTINIGADLGAMAAAMNLLLPINFLCILITFSSMIIIAQIFLKYAMIAKTLKWLCIFLLSYPLTLFFINAPWLSLLKATVIPYIEWDFHFLFIITGILGTTISPYLFFWQASEEAEEKKSRNKKTKLANIINLRIDNFVGMFFSQITTWSIIAVAAIVLNQNGINNINTAADAAKALEPFVHYFAHAGFIAECIFAIGMIGLGFLAVPVLAGSAAYALGEAFKHPVGLDLNLKQGFFFYAIIVLSTIIGCSLNFLSINPMKFLVYSAVINGIVAIPLIFIIARLGNNKKIMGRYTSGKISNVFVWLTFLGMTLTAIGMLLTFIN